MDIIAREIAQPIYRTGAHIKVLFVNIVPTRSLQLNFHLSPFFYAKDPKDHEEGTLSEHLHSSLSPTLCLDPSFFFSPFSVCRRKIPGPAKQLILDELNANSEFQASISTSKQCLTIMPKQYLVQDLLPCQQTSCSCHVMCH